MVELQTWTGVTWIKLRQLSSTTSAETIFSLIPCTHHRYRLQVANNAGTQTSEIIDFITQTEGNSMIFCQNQVLFHKSHHGLGERETPQGGERKCQYGGYFPPVKSWPFCPLINNLMTLHALCCHYLL